MPEPLLYVKAMGAAGFVSALFVLAMAALRRTDSTTRWNLASVPAIGLGLTVGYFVLSLQPALPPVNALDRLLAIIFPAALSVELVAGFQKTPQWAAWLLRMVLVAMIPRILLHGSVYLSGSDGWLPWQVVTTLGVCSLLLAVVWSQLAVLSTRAAGVSLPVALCMAIQSAAVTVMLAGYINGGAAALPLVATLLATTAAIWLVSMRSTSAVHVYCPAILGIGVVGLFSLLFVGRFFGRLSTPVAITILVAPLLCWTSEALPPRYRKPWFVGTLRLTLVAIPLVVVLALAKIDFDRDMAPLLSVLD
ncbi:hypothetical protein [Fuerstiella marisgermanici]|uniref:Uncharacterized protein n=1 Tax=Fuerstiella marisgermanici TaxID=1891926 RepID=A0A1P8WFV7_9PLAN|nr:hypothetical protein [Fuerstiella marisgermanici]APZ92944.1 hypothetical protein Fuma_02556 [Fuerstiella marisgermanici]